MARLLLLAVSYAALVASSSSPGQCSPSKDGNCDNGHQLDELLKLDAGQVAQVNEKVPYGKLGLLFFFFLLVATWMGATIKWALDGSLPARLALWGLLPEAYAAISVRAVAALLRMKRGPTPAIVLKNCIDDRSVLELAEALRRYGTVAELEVLELHYHPALSETGLRTLVDAALGTEGFNLTELDISYNQQLGDHLIDALCPYLERKSSKVATLRLMDSSLTSAGLKQLARLAPKLRLQTLDLSGNELGGCGESVVEVLELPVLEELNLMFCELSADDVALIAEQLPYTSLKSLRLGGNRFGSAGLLALCEHLPQTQIDELSLEKNDIEADALGALGTAWTKRPFSRLMLHGNRMSQEEVSAFIRTLRTIRS